MQGTGNTSHGLMYVYIYIYIHIHIYMSIMYSVLTSQFVKNLTLQRPSFLVVAGSSYLI